MIKKILYGIGIVFVLFILIGLIAPTPKQSNNQTPEKEKVEEKVSTTQPKPVSPIVKTNEEIKDSTPIVTKTETPRVNPVVANNYTYYSVSSIVDGDTLKINMNGNIETLRLIGMDTPETVDPRKTVQCFGKEASNKAKELLTGKKVRIEKDPTQGERDKYNRLLAYIHLEDGLFYNKYMIANGYAHEYTYNTPYKYQSEFKAAQKSAQANLLGLWSPNTCNGDTTSAAKTTVTTPTTQTTQTSGKFYTSSYSTSKYYYPASCDGWKSLNSNYLKSFDSLEALLSAYPSRIKSPQCP